jgi:hypothetical protein
VCSTVIVYRVAPVRGKVWGAPSAAPSCPKVSPLKNETVTETGPVPSVVISTVAVAVERPVLRKADTVTSLTAVAAGVEGADVVGAGVVSVSTGGVVTGSPVVVAVADDPPVPVAAGAEGDRPGDADASADPVGDADGDGEAEEGSAVGPAVSVPGPALVVARAWAASCGAAPGAYWTP